MQARELLRRRIVLGETRFAELVLWQLAEPLPPCQHAYKYRLALVERGVCVIRYDNERGKGDHRHVGDEQNAYAFRDVDTLLADFLADIRRWNDEHPDH